MKARLLAFALLLSTFTVKAQYVTIPDANFVTWLSTHGYSQCLNGNQLDTTCNAVVTATTIDCSGSNISNVDGVQYFDALEIFSCADNSLTSINNLPQSLLYLEAMNNQISSIASLPESMINLGLMANNLSALPEPLPANLIELNVYGNQFTVLPALPDNLQKLNCYYNQLTELPALPQSLEWLTCGESPITVLPAFPAGIKRVVISSLLISDVPPLPDSLEVLSISGNVNLRCFPIVKHVHQLNIGNLFTCMSYPTTSDSHDPEFPLPLCETFNENGCPPASVNISGAAYIDQNNNCNLNASENALPGIKVNLYSNGVLLQQTFTNQILLYTFDADNGNYETTIDTTNLPFRVSCPTNGILYDTLTITDSIHTNRNFALRCKTGFDLAVHSIHTGQIFRPANITRVSINAGHLSRLYTSSCAQATAGTVTVTINGPGTYISPSLGAITPSNVAGNVITYNVTNFNSINILQDFNINVQTDTFAQ